MKKVTTILLFVVCIGINNNVFCKDGATIDCDKIPSNPSRVAVLDNANIIDEASQAEIENQLRNYWIKDSIAVCVATIPTLGGYDQFDYSFSIAQCWGIGGKDNRGILLFIALNERKISIRTGYGLEAYLTDAQCSDIVSGMRPYFKNKEYNEGVQYAIHEILTTLKDIPWEDRVQAALQRRHAEQIEDAERLESVRNWGMGIILLLLVGFFTYLISRSIRRSKLRKHVQLLIENIKKEITTGHAAVQQASIGLDNAASWVSKEALVFRQQCENELKKASELLKKSESYVKKDVMEADSLLQESSLLVKKASATFVKLNQNLREKVQKFKTECPSRLSDAQFVVARNTASIQEYIKKGYTKFNAFLNEQNDLHALLQDYEKKISDHEFFPKIYTDSEIIKNKSNEIVQHMEQLLKQKTLIDQNLESILKQAAVLREDFDNHKKTLSSCKVHYPASVWQDVELKIKKVPEKFSVENIHSFRSEITDLNSHQQKFEVAFIKYTAFDLLVKDIAQKYKDLTDIIPNQEKNKGSYLGQLANVEKLVALALDETKDTDVSKKVRDNAKNIAARLRDVKIEAKKTIVDWVDMIAILNVIKNDANKVIKEAKQDISDADEERKREARATARAAEDSYNQTSVFSTSSFSSSSSSSSSSFGGFDGGSFGGGGADGGW